jgi:hypothetical protein
MNRQQLKQKLTERYSPENWKEILQYIFPNVALFQIPKDIPVTNDKVESFRQLGNVRLNDGKSLAIFDVQLNQETDIKRNRVELRNLTAKYIDQTTTHGVLAVFTSDLDDYRFTFTAKDTEFDENMELVTTQTEAKRYTYVLGPNESCKTPAERFFKLHETKDSVELENIIDAFSVEKLNKEFFNKYKEIYEEFVQFLTGKRFKKVSGKWKEVEIHEPHKYLSTVFENDSKLARDYVKKLLGRMVFLQFLQKKGWIGCSIQNSNWEDGDLMFCRNLFKSADQKQFHSNYLSKLFDALNTPDRENNIFEITNSRVPYLNGGLFEADIESIGQMDFPASHFESLLNFFGEYNFTIDENDPNDHEVGIDPEMLGHIFENLLEDNKDKGAFYTPKPIVQYMCQESLIQYLKTNLEDCDEDAVENFIRFFDKGTEDKSSNYIQQNGKIIEELLDKVKICDPAIGSGAFPMGLLQIIFKAKMTLDWTLDPAEVKRSIIQNSIYGVDIDKGAIDIARLRFWLSLIVDEKVPQPLPNLDYKIMQGNSLLESFEGVDLSQFGKSDVMATIDEPEKDLFGNIKEEQLFITQTKSGLKQEIQKLIDAYFNLTDMDEKQKVKAVINAKIHEHIDFNLELQEIQLQRFILEAGNYENLVPKNKKKVDKWQNEIGHLQAKRQNLHALQDEEEKPYFLWHLFFADVFKDGGFDLVIANPPYGADLDKDQKELLKKKYEHLVERIRNSYLYFLGKSVEISKQKGVINFIIPNEFLFQIYMTKARRYFLKHNMFQYALNVGEEVFDAIVPTCLLQMTNSTENNYTIQVGDFRKISLKKLDYLLQNKIFNKSDKNTVLSSVNSTFTFNPKNTALVNKLIERFKPFDDYCQKVSNGISTSCDEIYIVKKSYAEQNELENTYLKPCIRGGQFNRYYCPDDTGDNIVYVTKDFDKNQGRKILNYLKGNKELLIRKSVEKNKGNRPWHILFRSRNSDLFVTPKLLFRQTGDSIIASIDENVNYYPIDSVNIAILKVEVIDDIYFILGIMNSKLITFLYREISQEGGRVLAQVKPQRIRFLPIALPQPFQKDAVEQLVDQIICTKKSNPEADTSKLEHKIDLLVYELYGLSDNEISLVEDSIDS